MRRNKLSLLISCLCMSTYMFAAETEINEEDESSTDDNVIVVTADGREKPATEVAMNITAIGAEELRRKNITDVRKLIADSVEISSPGNSSRFAESVTVRGLNVSPVNANNIERFVRTTVAYYLDDTILPNIAYRIKDIDRVETLLGPQGTLYGGGSLGGTIRYITNKPDLEGFTADFNTNMYQVKDGSFSHDTDLVLNIPLSDTVAVRALFAKLDDGGFTDRTTIHPWLDPSEYRIGTPNPDQTFYEDDDWEETDTGRLQILWQPNDDFNINLSVITQDQLAHGTRGTSRWDVSAYCESIGQEDNCIATQEAPFAVDEQTIISVHEEYSDRTFDSVSLEWEWDLDFAILSSSSAQYEDTRVGQGDYINEGYVFYGQLAFIPSVRPENTNNSAYMRFDNEYEGFSHEMRLTSTGDGPVQWIAGFFHTNREVSLKFWEIFPGLDDAMFVDYGGFDARATYPDRGFLDSGYFEDISTDYTETAIYGELTYDITEDWDITVGARFFEWEDEALKNISDYTGFLGITEDTSTDEDSGSIFKLNTSYDLNKDVFLYGTISQGYRRGGTNAFRDIGDNIVADDTQRFDPDKTTNYEIGMKGSYFENSLSVTANIYRIDWSDTQTYRSQSILGFPLNGTTNGPDSRSQGIETHIRYRFNDNLSLRYSAAKTKAEFVETRENCLYENGTSCRTWFDGDELGGSPEWRHNASLNYTMELDGDAVLDTDLRMRYVDEQLSDRQTEGSDPYIFESFTTFDASATYSRDNWSATLWIDNLTDELEETSFQRVGGQWGYRAIFVRPRTVGVSFSYSYY